MTQSARPTKYSNVTRAGRGIDGQRGNEAAIAHPGPDCGQHAHRREQCVGQT
jgi:hypothetical protein